MTIDTRKISPSIVLMESSQALYLPGVIIGEGCTSEVMKLCCSEWAFDKHIPNFVELCNIRSVSIEYEKLTEFSSFGM